MEEVITPSPTNDEKALEEVERDLITLRMISTEYRDIPDAVKFQFKKDSTLLTALDRDFINRGKTFHARKARRHRLRRWQDEMSQSGLETIIDAMENHLDSISARTRRFMRNHGVVCAFENPEDLKRALDLV